MTDRFQYLHVFAFNTERAGGQVMKIRHDSHNGMVHKISHKFFGMCACVKGGEE